MATDVRSIVRRGYSKIAKGPGSCCGPAARPGQRRRLADNISQKIGYTRDDLKAVPEEANLGLGCGNPIALASLKEGETLLDLGSGAGLDCFLAGKKVGKKGKVIGVDMTPEMIEKARANAQKGRFRNVEFRLGEIENLPCADRSVDVVVSNCVINLSPDKKRVFREAFRVLRPGGRLMVSDIVLLRPLPSVVQRSVAAYVGCLSGALLKSAYLKAIRDAGFCDVEVLEETVFPLDCIANDPTAKPIIEGVKLSKRMLEDISKSILSIRVRGIKLN
jgi:SAM-dependent methyltransferase